MTVTHLAYTGKTAFDRLTLSANELVWGIEPFKGAGYVYVLGYTKEDFACLPADWFDKTAKGCRVKFNDKNNTVKLSRFGRRDMVKLGLFICQVSIAELEKYRKEGENELGHALERYLADKYFGQVLSREEDLRGRDVLIKLHFTATRLSGRGSQVKLNRYDNSAHLSSQDK